MTIASGFFSLILQTPDPEGVPSRGHIPIGCQVRFRPKLPLIFVVFQHVHEIVLAVVGIAGKGILNGEDIVGIFQLYAVGEEDTLPVREDSGVLRRHHPVEDLELIENNIGFSGPGGQFRGIEQVHTVNAAGRHEVALPRVESGTVIEVPDLKSFLHAKLLELVLLSVKEDDAGVRVNPDILLTVDFHAGDQAIHQFIEDR